MCTIKTRTHFLYFWFFDAGKNTFYYRYTSGIYEKSMSVKWMKKMCIMCLIPISFYSTLRNTIELLNENATDFMMRLDLIAKHMFGAHHSVCITWAWHSALLLLVCVCLYAHAKTIEILKINIKEKSKWHEKRSEFNVFKWCRDDVESKRSSRQKQKQTNT